MTHSLILNYGLYRRMEVYVSFPVNHGILILSGVLCGLKLVTWDKIPLLDQWKPFSGLRTLRKSTLIGSTGGRGGKRSTVIFVRTVLAACVGHFR